MERNKIYFIEEKITPFNAGEKVYGPLVCFLFCQTS